MRKTTPKATQPTTTQPVIKPETEPTVEEQIIELQFRIAYVQHLQRCASSRKARLEDLMQRRSAGKWDPTKKAKMVRRLITVDQTLEQCVPVLAELTTNLEKVVAGAKQTVNAAPFVPAPPTSLP